MTIGVMQFYGTLLAWLEYFRLWGAVPLDQLRDFNGLMYHPDRAAPFSGRAVRFHCNGRKSQKIVFREGRRHGVSSKWYRSGQLSERVRYELGLRHEKAETWHETGIRKSTASFHKGKKHGFECFWHPSGRPQREYCYFMGKPDGLCIHYSENGFKLFEFTCKCGCVQGKIKYFFPDGTVKCTKAPWESPPPGYPPLPNGIEVKQ